MHFNLIAMNAETPRTQRLRTEFFGPPGFVLTPAPKIRGQASSKVKRQTCQTTNHKPTLLVSGWVSFRFVDRNHLLSVEELVAPPL
jgi:hypothetical protein